MHINESIPFEDINADPEVNLNDKKYVVIYPGRFHPFHKGHASVYKHLKSKYDTVFIATSDKVAPPKSPFSFEEKKKMMMHTGVPANAIVQTKQPYIPLEILEHYDPASTVVIFAVSDKDMAEDPRFSFKPKKNGEPSYFQPLNQQNLDGYENHGYIITVPTLDFTVLDEPMRSATEFRSNFAKADHETQAAMIKDMYGTYNKEIHNIMAEKITESAYNWLNNDLVLNETFDQPYDYKWEMQHPKKWWATAELERPSVKLSIVIQKVFDNEWEIEFTRDMSQDKTGEGDAMRIFATVIKALKEFVADVHPEYINFRAEKTGSNTDSRPNLYRKLIKRYAKEWGYKDDEREKHSDGAYGINPKTEFLLTRSDLTNESCYNFLHEVGSNTITKSDFGATAWMTKKEWEYYTDRYDIAGDLNDKYSVMLDNTDMSRVGKVSVIETNGNRRRIVGSIDVKSYPGKLRFQTY
ncbi:MAG: adenylyltransferase/cytidyltransferase family protein, partial [Candidatus Brocadiales bacterium]|nr:adenylyltransferase/cytidyltransferase family protein [Candidatus Brocadiales bacterium]